VRRGRLAATRSWVLVHAWPVRRWTALMIAGTSTGNSTRTSIAAMAVRGPPGPVYIFVEVDQSQVPPPAPGFPWP
jgi:hypothetical protein